MPLTSARYKVESLYLYTWRKPLRTQMGEIRHVLTSVTMRDF
jgi:hypothetical protein